MRKIIVTSLVALVLSTTLLWAGGAPERAGGLTIVASTGHIGDAVARIAPDANLQVLMGPGSDPHSYTPTTREAQAIERADIVFWNGLELEIQMVGVFEGLGDRAFAVGEAVPERMLLAFEGHDEHGHDDDHDDEHRDDDHDDEHHDDDHDDEHDDEHDDDEHHEDEHDEDHADEHHEDGHGQYDPHLWWDIDIWVSAVQAIADRITEQDPDNASLYQSNATDYIAELRDLQSYATARFREVPASQRVLVTSHDGFGYLSRAYGFQSRGITGISTEDEASVRDLQELAQFIVDNDVRAVFFETIEDRRSVVALEEAVAGRGGQIVVSDVPLYSGALGESSPTNTFEGAYRHNVDAIVDTIIGNR
ncbi:MAG: zinc ABC transporter substrate-binding protein [Spirochaeta sp.]|nr:zinc ABC transporter substrate-binding protein [Spirochaeta sp.]